MDYYIEPDKKKALINAVFDAGDLFSASAKGSAMSAIRSQSKADLDTAKINVAQHDARSGMAKEVVDLINQYWPTDTKESRPSNR